MIKFNVKCMFGTTCIYDSNKLNSYEAWYLKEKLALRKQRTNWVIKRIKQRTTWCFYVILNVLLIIIIAYPAVYGQFPQAIPQQIAAVPAQREGKLLSASKTVKLKSFLPAYGLFMFTSYEIFTKNYL